MVLHGGFIQMAKQRGKIPLYSGFETLYPRMGRIRFPAPAPVPDQWRQYDSEAASGQSNEQLLQGNPCATLTALARMLPKHLAYRSAVISSTYRYEIVAVSIFSLIDILGVYPKNGHAGPAQ